MIIDLTHTNRKRAREGNIKLFFCLWKTRVRPGLGAASKKSACKTSCVMDVFCVVVHTISHVKWRTFVYAFHRQEISEKRTHHNQNTADRSLLAIYMLRSSYMFCACVIIGALLAPRTIRNSDAFVAAFVSEVVLFSIRLYLLVRRC